jgi:hypothetical protein
MEIGPPERADGGVGGGGAWTCRRGCCGLSAGLQAAVCCGRPRRVRIPEHSVSGSGDIRSAIPAHPVTDRVTAELGFVVSGTGLFVNL